MGSTDFGGIGGGWETLNRVIGKASLRSDISAKT